jgi:phage-related minor tail protein
MSTAVGSIHYDLGLNTSKFDSAASGLKSKIDGISDKFKDVGKGMTDVGKKMSLGITLPVVAGVGLAVKSASDLNETLNKVNVAFGASAKSVLDFGNTSLKSIGLAKGSALDAASLFGDMATSMGLSQSAAADMSVNMVKLGGDLASFKNISFEQAQTALAGVFTGETESLKRLGIVMTDTELNAFAVAKGIGKTTQEMTQAEKVNLRYAFVMEKTKNAQGDFSRTSEGTANQMRMSSERVKELSAQFGERLLPFIGKLLEVGNKFLSWFEKLSPKTQNIIFIFIGLLAVLGPLLIIFGQIVTAVGVLLPVFAAVFGAISAPVLIVIAIIAALAAAAFLIYKNWDKITAFFSALWEGVKNIFNSIWNFIKSVFQFIADLIVGFFTSYFMLIKAYLTMVWDIVTFIFNAIRAVISFVFNLIKDIIVGTWNIIVATVTFILTNLWNGINIIFNTILNIIRTVISTVYNVIVGGFNAAVSFVINIFNALRNGISYAVGSIINVVGSIGGRIIGFFAGAGSWLYNAGRDVIQGMLNGIGSLAGKIGSFFLDRVPGWIREPFKKALGIRSPSKEFMSYGKNITQGLVNGLGKGKATIETAIDNMAGSTINPMLQTQIPAQNASGMNATTNNNIYGNITLGDTEAVNTFFNRLDRNGELARKGMATI